MIHLKHYVATVTFKILNQPLRTIERVHASSLEDAEKVLMEKFSTKGRQLVKITNLKLIKDDKSLDENPQSEGR